MGEDHAKQCYGGIDDGYTQRKGPRDGLTHRNTQVDGRGVMF